MLHATAGSKSTLYERYIGVRDGVERKVYEEDEITSTVFGPLDFLEPAAVHQFWLRVLAAAGHENFLPDHVPTYVSLKLWERRYSVDDGKRVEPDALIAMRWSDGTECILLIELKWRAPLSGPGQLQRQWQHFLTKSEQERALHLFIAPEVSAGAYAPYNEDAGGDVWRTDTTSRLVLLPWLQIRSVLRLFAGETSGLSRWAKLAYEFLGRIQIREFAGFRDVAFESTLPSDQAGPIFWQPPPFWSSLGSLPILPKSQTDSIFFPISLDS